MKKFILGVLMAFSFGTSVSLAAENIDYCILNAPYTSNDVMAAIDHMKYDGFMPYKQVKTPGGGLVIIAIRDETGWFD